jgi:hypothetical protein
MNKSHNTGQPEGVFLDVIGTEILRLLNHAIQSHLQQRILLPYGFLGLEISTAIAESREGVGGGLGIINIISLLTFKSSICSFPYYTLFI